MEKVVTVEVNPGISSLVEEVEKGNEVVVTRNGKPVEKLIHVPDLHRKLTPEEITKRRQAIAELREIAKRINARATHEEIKSWINEGRH
jgi:prevent-host-death family protein